MKPGPNLSSILLPALAVLAGCAGAPALRDPAFAPVPPPEVPEIERNGAIFHPANHRFLFEDIKARRVGDTLTILLDEATNAAKSAKTSAGRDTEYDTPVPTLFGKGVTDNGRDILLTDVESGFKFSGEGDTQQSNRLSGSITVTVVEVLANGNLRVRGEKLVTLDQGSEVLRIEGIVRPVDISPANTVSSRQVAAASITYSGDGLVARAHRAGWFTRFFNLVWPF
ncbi:MAG: flagellar L-ring protein [Gammaproteobacteria bacterium]|nr:MAG: flagellar L-ring protein [Gammaproteobacteria bacterium]